MALKTVEKRIAHLKNTFLPLDRLCEDLAYHSWAVVAVGTDGTILSSSDGISWTPQTSGTIQNLRDVGVGKSSPSPSPALPLSRSLAKPRLYSNVIVTTTGTSVVTDGGHGCNGV